MGSARIRPVVRASWTRRLVITGFSAVVLLVACWFGLTSRAPSLPERAPPTAEEVGAGRDAVLQLRASRTDAKGRSEVNFGPAQFDGIAALASHGFRPDRLAINLTDGVLVVRGSHRLPGGRWLNAGLSTTGESTGFPPVRLMLGPLTIGPPFSRGLLEAGRQVLRLRGIDLPPLDEMVRTVAIGSDRAIATLSLPMKSGVVDDLAGSAMQSPDARQVVATYCRLVAEQRTQPASTLVEQLHRAVAGPDTSVAPVDRNRAAFIALAMLVVDDRAGDLAGSARTDSASCRIAPITVTLQGRADSPKHWALSAALAAGAGTQLSEAMGDWKELADSLARQAQFAVGDPTGFSFVDIAADRSGFRVAQAALFPGSAERVAAWLAAATDERLLPHDLTLHEDGLPNAVFVARYGGLSDPRFLARVAQIDRRLTQAGVPGT